MKRAEKMINDPKLLFIIDTIKSAYANYGTYDKSTLTDKAMFDLVTSTDFNIENYIISKIKAQYPQDKILSEETNSQTAVAQGQCTWTIDPIDGTYNMANGIKLYGIQCAMYIDGVLNLAALYLPHFDELYYAKAGEGAYLNG
jgi:myo-inositol-1(or 4)-monophosphatase